MKLYSHKNYQDYVDGQIEKYNKKKTHVWIEKPEFKLIVKTIKQHVEPEFGICHGVRSGYEVKYLQKQFENAIIQGTEIAPTKSSYIIQMDFHDIPDNWKDKFDFIYSNSFDHSNRPEYCLDRWMYSLKPDGICMIHWMESNQNKVDRADCFAATLNEYREMIERKYRIVDIVWKYKNRKIIVIKKREE